LCEQGSFQPDPEQLFCYPCPDGQTTLSTGSLNQAACIGRYLKRAERLLIAFE